MTFASDRGTAGSLPGSSTGSPWSLAGTRPQQLASRLAVAALAVGALGGMATACLTLLFGAAEVLPAARILAVALPLVLVALIGWRLVAATGQVRPAPSSGWIAGVGAVGVALIAVVQGWPLVGELNDDLGSSASAALAVVLYGTLFGLMAAAAAIVILVPAVLALRASRVRITLPGAQVLLTVVAMAVAAVFALLVTSEMDTPVLTGTAAALAGTGAVLTARWTLVDRQA
jgi:hypothetical protein